MTVKQLRDWLIKQDETGLVSVCVDNAGGKKYPWFWLNVDSQKYSDSDSHVSEEGKP